MSENHHLQEDSDPNTEIVATKDFSYSYVTLLPKDKREKDIYIAKNLEETFTLYLYFLCIVSSSLPREVFNYYSERTEYSLVNLIWTVLILSLRFLAYCFRRRYPRLFRAHLLIFYVLMQLRFAFSAVYKL